MAIEGKNHLTNQTFLLTGAHGFIGAWITKRLLEASARVVIFDRSADPHRLLMIMDQEQVSRVRLVTGDIASVDSLLPVIEEFGVTNLIHLAGLQVPTCRADPRLGAMVNVIGTINVFEAARQASGQINKIVYASSAAVFGTIEEDRPMTERDEPQPTSHYGVFKRCNEGNAHVYFLDHGISSVGLRPLTVYGVNRDAGLTSDPTKAMKAAVLGLPFHIRFGGATDVQYAADTAAAFIASADRAPQGAFVFNLHGESVEVSKIVEIINELSAAPGQSLVTFGGPPIPIAPSMSDASIRKVVGEVPSMPLEKGISETMRKFAELRDSGRLDT